MDNEMVSKYEHERTTAILERQIKRLFILVIVIFIALIGTNVGWIVYESQFQDVYTVTQETPSGNNNYVGHDGDITNGQADNNKTKNP